MSLDALVVANRAPSDGPIAGFAAAQGIAVTGDLTAGMVLQDPAGVPLVVLDPPLQVDGEEADRMLGADRRHHFGTVWWLELHAPAGEQAAGLLDGLARYLAAECDGQVVDQ